MNLKEVEIWVRGSGKELRAAEGGLGDPSMAPPRKEVPKTTPSEPKKKPPLPPESGE